MERTTRTVPRGERAADLETQAGQDAHVDLRLWLRLMTIHKLVKNEIGRALRAEFGATLPRFDLMSQLRRRPEGMRMVELSRCLMVTNGNVTAITDQLEKEGLVRRTVDAQNRSAFRVSLTPAGRRAFDAIARKHRAWLEQLFAGMSAGDKRALLDLLGRQKAALAARAGVAKA